MVELLQASPDFAHMRWAIAGVAPLSPCRALEPGENKQGGRQWPTRGDTKVPDDGELSRCMMMYLSRDPLGNRQRDLLGALPRPV